MFTTPDGRTLDPHWVLKEFKRLVAAAELPPIRFHDLRHTATSLMLASGMADIQLGEAAANLSVPTTIIAGRYDRLLPERMSRRIADTMQAAGHRPDYQVWPTGHLGNIEVSLDFS
ncbi:tyrosine-type recombinase/integrase [Nocardia sp. BMG51109]|uniref:tyrosine-type recombinase/integrase n=1 Tax=Nocardia sp. BMG51109 TaxID=1056816 RepID=UPI0012EB5E4A|nr:tyrosine-type recombinase/integrase [Nocardia sp. BMG51109]